MLTSYRQSARSNTVQYCEFGLLFTVLFIRPEGHNCNSKCPRSGPHGSSFSLHSHFMFLIEVCSANDQRKDNEESYWFFLHSISHTLYLQLHSMAFTRLTSLIFVYLPVGPVAVPRLLNFYCIVTEKLCLFIVL